MSGKNNIEKWPPAEKQKSLAIWELLASTATNLLLLIDRNYIYLAVNDSYLRAYNKPREEIVGHSAREILGPEIFDKFVKGYVDQCLAGEQVRYQSWFNYPTLGRRFMDVSYHPFFDVDGTITGVFADIHDITDLQTTEEALRQCEEKYGTVLDEMEESYYEVDIAGNFTYFNDAVCRQLGYSRQELMRMNYRVITPPEHVKKIFSIYNQVYRTGKPLKLGQMERIKKDGKRISVESSIFPLRNKSGEIIGFRGIARDVTERVQMVEAIRQSEERYRTVLDEMEDSYYEVDIAGNFTFFNDAMCRQLGYSSEETMGMNYRVITTPDDAENLYRTFNQVYLTGHPIRAFTTKIVQKDGKIGLGEISVFSLRNDKGEIIGFRGIAHNVTERAQMVEALRQSEEKYRTVLEQMEEAYYELDLAGNFTFFNDAMCRQLRYSREELMGMNYRAITPPENVKKAITLYNKVHRTGKSFKSIPMERIRKDGTRLYVESSVFPLRNERGKIIGSRGISRDITGLKQAEEEKRQMEQKAQLASRLACVGELASGIAHEINNPLTGVIGYAHLLLARKDIPKDIRHDLETINDGAQRVADIVKKLLIFAGRHKPERKLTNINEILSTTLDLQTYELASHNIKVAFQPASDLPPTIVDPAHLQQVFLNLIINAETEMSLAHGKGKLSIKTEQIDNTIRISFKDNGPGIAKKNMEKIFDPFFSTRDVGQGTGLGLSVCHGIITEHKGKIWAESKLGKGATFILELPVVTEDRKPMPPEPTVEKPKQVTKAKILVIDDEPFIRQLVSRVLRKEGHEVEALDNAEDALKMIKSKRYSLILLDIKMPGTGGINLYKQFQDIAASLKKRVVFITGDVMDKRSTDFLNKTRTPYIMKPFDAEKLKMEINRVLAK
jgi:PAS domain S-box-containing protein